MAYALGQAAQERRLAYRGSDVGMVSLTNEALKLLDAVVADAAATVTAVLEGRLRDRERGYLDVPFTVMAEAVAERAELAARLERARVGGHAPERETQAAVLALLDGALERIEGFCGVYDEKRPVASPRTTDLARVLARVERDAALARTARGPLGAVSDAPLPEVTTAADALEDLLRAARAALPLAPGPWRVTRGRAGAPLVLALGEARAGDADVPLPPRLERALRVLAFVHPVQVVARGRGAAPSVPAAPAAPTRRDWGAEPAAPAAAPSTAPSPVEPTITCLEVRLPDPAAGSTEVAAASGAGAAARLSPAAEKAVRALLAAPPLPDAGAAPPQRTIALLGLLKAFDDELARVLIPRLSRGALKAAAAALPRQDSRKAHLKPELVAALTAELAGLAVARLEDLVEDLVRGKAGRRRANAEDAALLLALFARTFVVGGWKAEPALDVAPLTEAEARSLAGDLVQVADVRRRLEAGAGIDAASLTRLERAAVSALGHLGRLP
jgi:hypothetical protein